MPGAFTLLALHDFVREVAEPLLLAPQPVPDTLSCFATQARGLKRVAAAPLPPPATSLPGAG